MDQSSLFSNDFKSVELCKQMQKKCSIESTNFKTPNEQPIDYYDEEDSIDENEICSVDEYEDQKNDNDSSASSRLSVPCFKYETHPLTELNRFVVKNKLHNELVGPNTPFTPAGRNIYIFIFVQLI